MASRNHRLPENAPGKFYVDSSCISNGACLHAAPNNFARRQDGSAFFVCKQPETDQELRQVMEALEGCPVDAIRSDGDQEIPPKPEGVGSRLQRWLRGGR